MKVLIYQPRVSYFTGGGEVYPLQNAIFFAKHGHDVTLLTTKASYLKECDYFKDFKKRKPANLKIEYIELDDNYKFIYDEEPGMNWERWDKESLFVSREAYRFLCEHKYDIVAIHNIMDLIAVPLGVKHVIHFHGTPSELNYTCKLLLENEKNILAVSENVREGWKKLGINKKMIISTNAIDPTVFKKIDVERTNDLLFVGRIIEIKGLQYAIEALNILREKYNFKPTFRIIGKGPYLETIKELVKKYKLEDQVQICGLAEQDFLIKSYQESKLALQPSYVKEGIMSTLLEAASCGTPSITTKGTSMQEFALDNKNAYLVNPQDANDLAEKIYMLLNNQELLHTIGENAYNEVMKKYTWESKSEELIKYYEEF